MKFLRNQWATLPRPLMFPQRQYLNLPMVNHNRSKFQILPLKKSSKFKLVKKSVRFLKSNPSQSKLSKLAALLKKKKRSQTHRKNQLASIVTHVMSISPLGRHLEVTWVGFIREKVTPIRGKSKGEKSEPTTENCSDWPKFSTLSSMETILS